MLLTINEIERNRNKIERITGVKCKISTGNSEALLASFRENLILSMH